jgi:hypothetical protein
MSTIGFKTLFQLKDNFTKEELKSAFMKKINDIQNNKNLSNIDKEYFLQELQKMYKQGKNELLYKNNLIMPFSNNMLSYDNIFLNQMSDMNKMISSFQKLNLNDNNFNNSVGYQTSIRSVIGNDGVKYIEETTKTIKNNKVDIKTNTFKIDKNGNKIFINPNELKQIID